MKHSSRWGKGKAHMLAWNLFYDGLNMAKRDDRTIDDEFKKLLSS